MLHAMAELCKTNAVKSCTLEGNRGVPRVLNGDVIVRSLWGFEIKYA